LWSAGKNYKFKIEINYILSKLINFKGMMHAYLQLWGGRVQILCPYVDPFVRKFYELVPPDKRIRLSKGWLMDPEYYRTVLPLIKKYFPKPVISGSLIFLHSRLTPEEIEQRRQEHYRKLDEARGKKASKTKTGPASVIDRLVGPEFLKLCRAFGLPDKPTVEVLKDRYRVLSLRYHPDKGGDKGKMQIINRAYHKLKEDLEKEN
jgi:hypothetical protein